MNLTRLFFRDVPKRLLSALPVLFGILVITFVLMRVLPGDPASMLLSSPSAGEAELSEIRQHLGLDKSLPQQLWIYLKDVAQGDFGTSSGTGQPVLSDLMQRLPASLELVGLALLVALVLALPLGVIAALRVGSAFDHIVRIICTIGVSIPTFVSGLLLVYIFYFELGWAPDPTGRLDVFALPPPTVTGFLLIDTLIAGDMETFVAALSQLVLPAATLALFVLAPLARVTRASMLGVLNSDFVRTARSLGLSNRLVIVTYALKNAMLPVLTVSGAVISTLLGASVLVEKVFAWPGIASYAADALASGDFAPVQGFVLFMATIYVFVNLAIDILYRVFDPRVSL
jgi:peptide/nickel transport system permease protein